MSVSKRSKAESSDFSLFAQEEAVIAGAEQMLLKLEEVADGVRALAQAYNQGYREQQRLVRLSDRMQDELRGLNAKLEAEVAAREELAGKLTELASTDSLTGAATRRRLSELAEHERRRCFRESKPLSLVVTDIDRFKAINDGFGHAAGDAALVEFVARLRREIRDSDVIGRMGGEEFAVLLPDSDLGHSMQVAERLRAAIANTPIPWEGVELTLTSSFGVAQLSGPDDTFDALLSRADRALYGAKRAGRNLVMAEPD